MGIKRYIFDKDNTITNAFKVNLASSGSLANMGASDVMEIFSIYGQADTTSIEKSRMLFRFPIDDIPSDVASRSEAKYFVKLFNATHNQTTPENYWISVHPLMQAWEEGNGLDMESYLDNDASNWESASFGVPWHNSGSDYVHPGIVVKNTSAYSREFKTEILAGSSDIEIDITKMVENWLSSTTTAATAEIEFDVIPSLEDEIKLISHQGQQVIFEFTQNTAGMSGSSGERYFVPRETGGASNINNALNNLVTQIGSAFNNNITATWNADSNSKLQLTQSSKTWYGNTFISSSFTAGVVAASGVPANFTGGAGATNYGFMLKMSGSYEDGTRESSYYTKKVFSRSSQYELKRPCLEVRWDDSIKDDRGSVIKSTTNLSNSNTNTLYLYNWQKGVLTDIPSAITDNDVDKLKVKLFATIGGTQEGANIDVARHSKGIYSFPVTYSGDKTFLYDVWALDGTEILTGSGFSISSSDLQSSYINPEYVISITNLQSSYYKDSEATFRIYTRDKNWKPNLYTVASAKSPVNNIKDMFYRVKRVSDNFVVIDYSTSSAPSFSQVSYDSDGSFFNLDMSLLEANYMYEISFLYKINEKDIEQKEKFRFRIEK